MPNSDQEGGGPRQLWFRESSNSNKTGPYSLSTVSKWYDENKILPLTELSADEGRNWETIESLRNHNGPAFPFCSFHAGKNNGGIEIARKAVSSTRSEVDRLEEEVKSIMKQLAAEESMLEKLKQLDEILERGSCDEIEEKSEENASKECEDESTPEETYDRETIMELRDFAGAKISFHPTFFCHLAFRLCANDEHTAIHHVGRIGPALKTQQKDVSLIGPLAILAPCDDITGRITTDPVKTLMSLSRFTKKACNRVSVFAATKEVHALLRPEYDAFAHSPPIWCKLCNVPISSSGGLIRHVISSPHTKQIKDLDTSVDFDAFIFWRDAINRGFDGTRESNDGYVEDASFVVETEEPQDDVEVEMHRYLSREEIERVGREMRTLMNSQSEPSEFRHIFRPRFFCPRAFKLVAREESTVLNEMKRVCASRLVDQSPVPLEGPLAILDRCDDPQKSLEDDVRTALRQLHSKTCDRIKLRQITIEDNNKMLVNFDNFVHPSRVVCAICDVSIASSWNLIKHVNDLVHISRLEQLGTSVDEKAYMFWFRTIRHCSFDPRESRPKNSSLLLTLTNQSSTDEWNVQEMDGSLDAM